MRCDAGEMRYRGVRGPSGSGARARSGGHSATASSSSAPSTTAPLSCRLWRHRCCCSCCCCSRRGRLVGRHGLALENHHLARRHGTALRRALGRHDSSSLRLDFLLLPTITLISPPPYIPSKSLSLSRSNSISICSPFSSESPRQRLRSHRPQFQEEQQPHLPPPRQQQQQQQ